MSKYFIPYSGTKPASVEINGHRLIFLSKSRDNFEEELDKVGADTVKVVKIKDDTLEEEKFFSKLARKNDAGVVIVPAEASCDDLILALSDKLPWIQ